METEFYLDLAKKFTQDPDTVARLALTFQSRDFDKKRVTHDKEQPINIEKQLMEMEKQQMKMEMVMQQRESFYKHSLSFWSQRYVLESFFNKVVTHIRNSLQLRDHIGTKFPKNKLHDLVTNRYPKMSYVNEFLRIAETRQAIWECMGIDEGVSVPEFPRNLTYGLVSLGEYFPGVVAVYVSDKMDPTFIEFFKFVSARSRLVVEVYDEEAASAGEDLVTSATYYAITY